VLGRTGSGKSVLLANMAIQDIKNGEGLCVIDPHGDLIQDILQHVPKERAEDIVLFEPFDMERPLGLNMLEVDSEEQKDFAVQEMISIFYKLVTDPAMLSAFGAVLTSIIAGTISYYFSVVGISLVDVSKKGIWVGGIYLDSLIYPDFGMWIFPYTFALPFISIFLTTLIAVLPLLQLEPATALRRS
jgi:hypothetical protein